MIIYAISGEVDLQKLVFISEEKIHPKSPKTTLREIAYPLTFPPRMLSSSMYLLPFGKPVSDSFILRLSLCRVGLALCQDHSIIHWDLFLFLSGGQSLKGRCFCLWVGLWIDRVYSTEFDWEESM